MSFRVKFTRFAKRVNSTLQPGGSYDWGEFDCILKEGCSTVNPTIGIQFSSGFCPAGYNYAYISDFGRYYFIKEWYFENRIWYARMRSDPLASFKAKIASYNGYVVRSAAAFDGDIVDMLYPAQAEASYRSQNAIGFDGWVSDFDKGHYVLGIIGKDNGQNGGGVTYYSATPSQMRSLVNYMLKPTTFSDLYGTIDDISEDLLKCIFNPLQYIVSCMWFPTTPITQNGSCNVGWWTVSGLGIKPLSTLTWGRNCSWNIPKHPQAAARGNYLNMPPFSTYHLYAGPWGIIPVDNSNLIGVTSLQGQWKIDYMTGSGKLRLYRGESCIGEYVAQVGVPIQLGQNVLNQGALSNAVTAPANAISSAVQGDIGGIISNAYTGIMDAAQLTQGVLSTVGSNGSFTYENTFKLIGKFFNTVGEDLASRGRPLCQPRTLGSLAGYIMCADADPAIDCTDEELNQIVNYLNTGFYME